jgi:hypothetical protein
VTTSHADLADLHTFAARSRSRQSTYLPTNRNHVGINMPRLGTHRVKETHDVSEKQCREAILHAEVCHETDRNRN